MSKRKQKKQRMLGKLKEMKPLVGIQLQVVFTVTLDEDMEKLLQEVEDTIQYIDEAYVLEDFNVVPIYEEFDDGK